MEFSSKYEIVREVIEGKHPRVRYVVVTGGRGSGKSYPISIFVLLLMNNLKRWCMMARFTMQSIKDSIMAEFLEKLELMNLSKYYDVQKDRVKGMSDDKNKNPKRLTVFKGLKPGAKNQTSRLRGLNKFSVVALDEAQEIPRKEDFLDMARSIRSNVQQNIIILMLNPATKQHWIYKYFFEDAGVQAGFCGIKGNTCYVHTTYLDNIDNLPDDIIEEYETMKVRYPKEYDNVVMGGWLDAIEGVIFQRWRLENPDGSDRLNYNSLPHVFGLDFGFSPDPASLNEIAIDVKNRTIYVEEKLYKTTVDPDDLKEFCADICKEKLIIADSARNDSISYMKKRTFKKTDTTKQIQCNIIPVVKGKVDEEVKLMEEWLIVLIGDSHNVMNELTMYHRENGIIIDKHNHAIDNIRYCWKTLFNYKTPKQNKVMSKSMYGERKTYGD